MDHISVCGVCCPSECRAYGTECAGCVALQGKVSWAAFYNREHCPIWDCVREKGLSSCAHCGQAPCDIWNQTRNPDASDEEFAADINRRLRNLAALRTESKG